MRQKLKLEMLVCIAVFCLLGNRSSVSGAVAKGDLGIGLNFPGGSVRYLLRDNFSLELKGQMEDSIGIIGLRGNWYFSPEKKLLPYAGLEADFVSFEGDVSKGRGTAVGLFAGLEYFFLEPFSVQLDIGPALISLKDDGTSESVSGVEYVVNFGINYYFRSSNQ